MTSESIPDLEFIDNTNQRTPCVLVLDGSSSMEGGPISELNAGLKVLEEELKEDITARTRVQLLVIRVGGSVETLIEWTDAVNFSAPRIEASGGTPLAEGMILALDMIEEQKRRYNENGITYTRPWIFLISDGHPTDDRSLIEQASERCVQMHRDKKVEVFSIGCEGADLDALALFSNRPPKLLDGLKFRELFVWLSASVRSASVSAPEDTKQLAATDSWSTAAT